MKIDTFCIMMLNRLFNSIIRDFLLYNLLILKITYNNYTHKMYPTDEQTLKFLILKSSVIDKYLVYVYFLLLRGKV